MSVFDSIDVIRSISTISSSAALKYLPLLDGKIKDELQKTHTSPYLLNDEQIQTYQKIFKIPANIFMNGKKKCTHPVSAALRDYAVTQTFHWLHKLHSETPGLTLRLYNPKTSNVNSILNMNLYAKVQVFYGKCHPSDLKRQVNPTKVSFKVPINSNVEIEAYKVRKLDDIFDFEGQAENVCILLLDDMYHANPAAFHKFLNFNNPLSENNKNRTIVSIINNQPLTATKKHCHATTFPHGTRVVIGEPHITVQDKGRFNEWDALLGYCSLDDVKTQQCYNTLDADYQEYMRDYNYVHYLEDGTSYSGNLRTINQILANKPALQQYDERMMTDEIFRTELTNTCNSIVSEPLCAFHTIFVFGKSILHKPEPTEINDPDYLRIVSRSHTVVLTQSNFARVKGSIMATKPNDQSPQNCAAHYRTDPELRRMNFHVQAALTFGLLSEYFDLQNRWSSFSTGKIVPFSALVTATGYKYLQRVLYKFSTATNLENFAIEEFRYYNDNHAAFVRSCKQQSINLDKIPVDNVIMQPDTKPDEVGGEVTATQLTPGQEKHYKSWSNFISIAGEKVESNDKRTAMQLFTLVNTQINKLSDTSIFKSEYQKITKIVEETEADIVPIIDLLINGVAGSGKTWRYVNEIANIDLKDMIIVSPTSDLVRDIHNEMNKANLDWRVENKFVVQTYERALKRLEGRHVILEEAYLLPSAFIAMTAILRSQNVVKSLTVVGDYQQNTFNENIIPAQEWPDVISLLMNNSLRMLKLTECRRCPQIVGKIMNALFPDIPFTVKEDNIQGELEIVQNPVIDNEATYIGQSNDICLKALSKGFKSVMTHIKAQGATRKRVIFEPVNELYQAGFYVGITRVTEKLTIVLPSSPSAEMQEKINILQAIVQTPNLYRDATSMAEPAKTEPAKVPEVRVVHPEVVAPGNKTQLEATAFDEVERDISSYVKTDAVAQHSDKNKPLFDRSLKASLTKNPELVQEKVNMNEVFPELSGFKFEINDDLLGMATDKYLSKIKGGKALLNQIKDDINEMQMNLKVQQKGGLTRKNKKHTEKVGQIVRASSKYFQIAIGMRLNLFFAQLHAFLKTKNVFTGCGENDTAAALFCNTITKAVSVVTFDTVKNESRVGKMTKAFEREFIQHFSQKQILASDILEHDGALYVKFGDSIIDCSEMRNSGEIATLGRNWLANYCFIKLRMVGETPNTMSLLMKGDNSAIFSTLPKHEVLERFREAQNLGTIEIDEQEQWTSYYIHKTTAGYDLIPDYTVISERLMSRVYLEKELTVADFENYAILFSQFDAMSRSYADQYPELFDDVVNNAYNYITSAISKSNISQDIKQLYV